MRIRTVRWFGVISLAIQATAFGQAFVNLDFEQTTITPSHPFDYVDPAVTFPGWTVQATNRLQSVPVVSYNAFSLSAPAVILMGPEFYWHPSYFALQQFPDPGYQTLQPSSISQIGTVPADARSLQFTLVLGYPFSFMHVTLDGVRLPLNLDGRPEPNVDLRLQADVSAFAGQTVELKFTIDPQFEPPSHNSLFFGFDDIYFSPTPVPEPNSFCLLSLGVLLLRWRRHQSGRFAYV